MKKKLLMYGILPVMIAILGASQASAHGWFGFGSNLTPDEIAAKQTIMFQKQADLLGVSLEAIKQGWAEGKTLSEIAQDNGISQTDLKKVKDAAFQQLSERLKTLVEKGVITQAQADVRLRFEQSRVDKGMGKMFGKGFHHGGWF